MKGIIIYIVAGLLIAGSIYGVFIYSEPSEEDLVASLSESVEECPACECPDCPPCLEPESCEPEIIVKEVIKEVIKEVPVIKEVIKEVPVEKIVEKVVIKEVPVETIVYQTVPQECPDCPVCPGTQPTNQLPPIIEFSTTTIASDDFDDFTVSNTGETSANIKKLVLEIIKLDTDPSNIITVINLAGRLTTSVDESSWAIAEVPFGRLIEFPLSTTILLPNQTMLYRIHFSVTDSIKTIYYQFKIKYIDNSIVNSITSENVLFNDLLLPEKSIINESMFE